MSIRLKESGRRSIRGGALGNDQFKTEIELMTGRRMTAGKVGRPLVRGKALML